MHNDFTIFFTFFADGEIRRKYIEIALKTLFEKNDKNIPILVIDSSSKNYSKSNKTLFLDFPNLTYINDTEKNPFIRCNKYLHLIKTKYVIRLLEDCAYLNLSDKNFQNIKNDINLLNRNKAINVIQYPIINEQKFRVEENIVYYPKNNFTNKKLLSDQEYIYYDRSDERKIYHYLCNNILYRTKFFIKHWNFISSRYSNHSSAESGDLKFNFYKSISNYKYLVSIVRLINRYLEKIFYSECVITNIFITETMKTSDVIHIGYYSTEENSKSNSVRKMDNSKNKGTVSVLQNLKVFNDIKLLNNIKFKREETF